ncbi:hypothetical protein QTP70_011699 [Hemibagrus guttatus]|uniref:Uncharacterized protein n=1 Tax=Hemibagrus guttatus TaxID=175788 RepID=A0AAE0VCI2_9TELE|nr:hypothetical protein QTP70_011699 [Hemibagrus guttatus]
MQLHKAQLSKLARNKQDIMEKKKEEKSMAKQAAVLVAQPVAPPVAQPALPMPQPVAMTQAMPIVPPQQMQPVYYASVPLTMYPPVQQYLPQNRGWGQGRRQGRGGGTFQQPMRGRASMNLGKRGFWVCHNPSHLQQDCLYAYQQEGPITPTRDNPQQNQGWQGPGNWTGPWMGPNQQFQGPVNSGVGPMGPTPGRSVAKTHGADWMRKLSSSCTFHPVSTQSTDDIQDQWQPPNAQVLPSLVDTIHTAMRYFLWTSHSEGQLKHLNSLKPMPTNFSIWKDNDSEAVATQAARLR